MLHHLPLILFKVDHGLSRVCPLIQGTKNLLGKFFKECKNCFVLRIYVKWDILCKKINLPTYSSSTTVLGCYGILIWLKVQETCLEAMLAKSNEFMNVSYCNENWSKLFEMSIPKIFKIEKKIYCLGCTLEAVWHVVSSNLWVPNN